MWQCKRFLMVTLAAGGLVLGAEAQGSPDCGDENGPKAACPAGSFAFVLKDGSGETGICEDKSRCIPLDAGIGPAPSFITCERQGGGFQCQAWPQGEMKYDWVLGEGLEAKGTRKGSSNQKLACSKAGGSTLMSVTVTAPNGLSETVFSQVSCAPRNRAPTPSPENFAQR
jgi:hypothetical protein